MTHPGGVSEPEERQERHGRQQGVDDTVRHWEGKGLEVERPLDDAVLVGRGRGADVSDGHVPSLVGLPRGRRPEECRQPRKRQGERTSPHDVIDDVTRGPKRAQATATRRAQRGTSGAVLASRPPISGTVQRSTAAIPDRVSDFGDSYTRVLTLAQRELLVLCALVTVGGTSAQLGPYSRACLQVGNAETAVVAALVHCLPYIGFP